MRRLFVAVAIILECLSTYKAQSGVSPPAYAIVINLPAFRLYLYRDGELWHDYPVAIGKPSTPTPVGEYHLVCKVRDPIWYPKGKKPVPPGPENPLGRWWLGLSVEGYGIHGCLDESSIGRAVSNGCLRLHNRDVAQLVECVGVGTPVRIVYELFALREDLETGRIWLWAGEDIYWYGSEDAAERYLTETATLPWEREATRSLLSARSDSGWLEVPQPVEVFCRRQSVGLAYLLDGQIRFARRLAKLLPGGAALAETGPDVCLEELAGLGAETVDWRYVPELRALMAYPARLRRGEDVRESGVRVVLGRVMVDLQALAGLTRGAADADYMGDIAAMALTNREEAETWESLADALAEGWPLRWSPEEWEVVLEVE